MGENQKRTLDLDHEIGTKDHDHNPGTGSALHFFRLGTKANARQVQDRARLPFRREGRTCMRIVLYLGSVWWGR